MTTEWMAAAMAQGFAHRSDSVAIVCYVRGSSAGCPLTH